MGKKVEGYLYGLLCIFFWSLIPVVAKLGQSSLDTYQFLFYSSLVSFVSLFVYVLFTGHLEEIKYYNRKDWIWALFLGLLGTYIYYLLLYFGYKRAKGLDVLVMQYTWPLFVAFLSPFVLKERLSFRRITGILFGFAGVVVVLTRGNIYALNLPHLDVLLLVLLASLCFALFSLLSKGFQKEVSVLTTIYFFAATGASLISLEFFSSFVLPSTHDLGPILLNGVLVNGFSYIFWIMALKRVDASSLASLVFLTPVLAAVNLILFFGETFLWIYAVGLFLILFGSYLAR